MRKAGEMRRQSRWLCWLLPVLVASGACSGGATPETAPTTPAATDAPVAATDAPAAATTEVTVPVEPPVTSVASPSPSEPARAFPTEAFADISVEPVAEEMAAELRTILNDMAGDGGMTATVMSADGTWSGAAGTADGVRDVRVDDQFFIASITKSVVAAQVMHLVEAGELSLDDLAADHLPADLDFDTNQATIRQLLGQRSGIPDYLPMLWDSLSTRSAASVDDSRGARSRRRPSYAGGCHVPIHGHELCAARPHHRACTWAPHRTGAARRRPRRRRNTAARLST